MVLNIADVQDEILEHLENNIPQRVVEQAIPDASTVDRNSRGDIDYYVAVQFGDLQYLASGRGFAGTRYDDYEVPIYVQVVGPDAKTVRGIANRKVLDALIGMDFDWCGEIRKRPGGAMWPLISSNGATEAYMFPVSFAITVQMADY